MRSSKLKDVAETEAAGGQPQSAVAQLQRRHASGWRGSSTNRPASCSRNIEDLIEALDASSVGEALSQYRFRSLPAGEYPDATFTPRVTFGAVKGYSDKTEAP